MLFSPLLGRVHFGVALRGARAPAARRPQLAQSTTSTDARKLVRLRLALCGSSSCSHGGSTRGPRRCWSCTGTAAGAPAAGRTSAPCSPRPCGRSSRPVRWRAGREPVQVQDRSLSNFDLVNEYAYLKRILVHYVSSCDKDPGKRRAVCPRLAQVSAWWRWTCATTARAPGCRP